MTTEETLTIQEIVAGADRVPPYKMPPNRAEAIQDLRRVGIYAVQRNHRKCGWYDLYFLNEHFATVSCAELYNRWAIVKDYAEHASKKAVSKIIGDSAGVGI